MEILHGDFIAYENQTSETEVNIVNLEFILYVRNQN